jgi:biotin carboxyl carrier protein
MDDKDERIFRKIIDTTVKDLVIMAKGRNLEELRVETGPLAIRFTCHSEERYDGDPASHRIEEPGAAEIPVTANMVGIFHRALTPYEPPVIEKGADIVRGQVIGYIESMRLMHEVRSPCSGKVKEIKVEENKPVEYGQTLLMVEGRGQLS